MFSDEIRQQILSDIASADPAVNSNYQKQNKRVLKVLLVGGVEKAFARGAIKLPRYRETVNSMLTLFNAYHSGYRYSYIGYVRKQKVSKKILDRINKVGCIGLLLEGLVKPWELYRLVKSIEYMKKAAVEDSEVQALLRFAVNDPNSAVSVSLKEVAYKGLDSITEERKKSVLLEVEKEKHSDSSSSSSSSSN